MGCATPEGATGSNIARQIALRAGLPITTAASPSTASARAACRRSRWPRSASSPARRRLRGRRRREHLLRAARGNTPHAARPWLHEHKPEIYWNMLQTAEQVAKRYSIAASAWTSTAPRASRRPAPRWKPAVQGRDRAITVTAGVADR
jgi:acetyl-CoA C-acetyltransferase